MLIMWLEWIGLLRAMLVPLAAVYGCVCGVRLKVRMVRLYESLRL